ncbi:MAG TPA: DNA adenine methylase [Longimicrobiales bacterium]|nr:DNA adenine methylase [Longimicrobiales bacterium]
MRYLGNKTKLLGFIGEILRRRGIRGGTAVDPFCGTASVSRSLKRRGFHVIASDILEMGHVFARTYVQAAAVPDLSGLAEVLGRRAPTLADIVAYLNRVPPAPDFISTHFAPRDGLLAPFDRRYFRPENAARIDAVRGTLEAWRRAGLLGDDGYYALLASLIEAVDRVANTTGVYASWVKTWQPNARRTLHLSVPHVVPGGGCRADRADAIQLVTRCEPFDLLYIDPPYNNRQYCAYYHIPEILATGWFDGPTPLRGVAGLLHDADKRSVWSSRRRAGAALEELVARAPCSHFVMSYNAEGIIPERTIERVFRSYGRIGTYRRYTRRYRRYRSDHDRANRRYRSDTVEEHLYCVSR